MPQKQKLSPSEKVELIQRYLAGEIGVNEAGRLAGVDSEAVRGWIVRYETEGIEILRNGQENKKETANFFKAPERFSCLKATVVDPRLPAVIFSGNFEEDCWYFIGNTCKKLKSRVSGVQSWDSLNKLLFIELAANAKVAIFQMPEARENAKPAAPNRLKPANRNHSFALLSVPALKNNMVQIDNRGNVFLLDYSKMGRWKKYSVYVADQAGFRN